MTGVGVSRASSRRTHDLEAIRRLTQLGDLVVPVSIRAACELEIPDRLLPGPLGLEELAEACDADQTALLRLMRVLTGCGICAEDEGPTFSLEPLGRPLCRDHPLSMREAYPLIPADMAAWGHLDHSVRTGGSAFELVHGTGYWEYMADHPDESSRFDGTQRAASGLELRALLPAWAGWPDVRSIVDVGGGNGGFLAGILARFPQLSGTLLDLPHVVAGAPAVFEAVGLSDRARAVGGSFFDEVPAGADVYLVKRVLYHWDPESAVKLLGNLRDAMRPDSTLLLLEPLAEPGTSITTGKLYDIILLAMAGGGLRSQEQVSALMERAGLRLVRVHQTMMFPVIEARRVDAPA